MGAGGVGGGGFGPPNYIVKKCPVIAFKLQPKLILSRI
jgi:hypothetical protein